MEAEGRQAEFFQPDLYAERTIGYEDFTLDREFSGTCFSVTAQHLAAYRSAVARGLPEAKAARALESAYLPTLVSLSFGFVYAAMRGTPPAGFLNTSLEINLLKPVQPGEPLEMSVKVVEREIKRDRPRVTLEAVVLGAVGPVARQRIGCVLPA